jgi:primary-amine oxidase
VSRHPLDPLTADEIRQTAALVRAHQDWDDWWRFASIDLVEPAKQDLLQWQTQNPTHSLPRRAMAVIWNRANNNTYEVVADLSLGAVESRRHIPGVTPNFTVDEFYEAGAVIGKHPEVIAALAEYGITDMALVLFDVWTYGEGLMPPQWRDRRLGWADIWVRATPNGNPYAHPVPGLKVIIDINAMEVLQLDRGPVVPMPEVDGEYDPDERSTPLRTDIKDLQIIQPEGVSFSLEGNLLTWQNWSLRLGFNYREGPVLHQLSYNDHGRERKVAHRMSFAEMVVPYRDASFDHYRRTAYDIGEWGLGYMTTSLELGCDCLGVITYQDATLSNSAGEPYTIKNAICLHEEDNAVLWKHVDSHAGAEVRRMRRMVISTHATVANYEYLIYWRLYQDGNIECEVRATGIMVTTPFTGEPPKTGAVVDHNTYAPYHQHFLVARLDLDVDGTDGNSVYEVDSMALPITEDNPYGLALTTQSAAIATESEAARDYDWHKQRSWKVENPNTQNKVGGHPAYKLVPSGAFPAMLDPESVQYKRAPVIGHTLWVTKHHDNERWPAGDYPTQSASDQGMSQWVANHESLENTDIVLWYVFGIHHITRMEEWPIMSADVVSFWLKPSGFFDQNPALDVPPNNKSGTCHT